MSNAVQRHRKIGLAFKLALFILTGTVCIFAAGFTYNYYSSKEILLKNAVEHGEAANCMVSLAPGDSLQLTIRDDGAGLPQVVTRPAR